ncbi:P-loop containing nucleoside triphosphate hydrolase protein [Lentinus brumalis]|uniref:P-loop containing nucleoside triphosphate hydrolase protein n=1 Tax=Lentinus brumalis TaxID=2498619 RepID=A0A371DVJ1_9APHY|nr:P-loop containing nucleoside triphosphate hydrolase protein [Polyporus brumalis]
MATTPILELKKLAWYKEKGQPVFTDVNLVLNEGDILVLQGKSGSGKSTLLKCVSHLNIYEGEVLYRGQKPQQHGIPTFRTRVMYVPQRPSMLPGTPRDFLRTVYTFGVHKSSSASSKAASAVSDALRSSEPDLSRHEAFEIAEFWGIDRELWDRSWTNLSGGEAQRIVLAIAVGIASAEVLLLDEPTSALDSESSSKVERHLAAEVKSPDSKLKSIVWITHSPEQGQRVGTRFIRITSGGVREEETDPGV